jgi:hypothetical protein
LSCANKCCVNPNVMSYNNIFHCPLTKVVFFLMTKEDLFSIIKIRTPNIMPHISSDTTSKSTSSINFESIENLTLYCLVTLSFSLSHTQPRG